MRQLELLRGTVGTSRWVQLENPPQKRPSVTFVALHPPELFRLCELFRRVTLITNYHKQTVVSQQQTQHASDRRRRNKAARLAHGEKGSRVSAGIVVLFVTVVGRPDRQQVSSTLFWSMAERVTD